MYASSDIAHIIDTKDEWLRASEGLFLTIICRDYVTATGSEYAKHGLCRRIRALTHLTERIFSVISLGDSKSPSKRDLHDAEAFIQSFLLNVYGAIDNMARIWCVETDLRNKKGLAIPDGMIGFGRKNLIVRESLPYEFRAYLIASDPWFEYLENYRHAVAHRIPVYIPPATLSEQDAEKYAQIEAESQEAAQTGNWRQWDELMARQRSLGKFQPLMTHSYGEKSRPVTIHGQIICDVATVVEIGRRLVASLSESKNTRSNR
ncbi:hypothetical protein [Aurantimonas sp. 22II-16-19i]|uniref:hypothetical protein n=1 Tax=Aurantimonas sp. 22II-16-19i TaxID=1317114 RepID=UPI00111BF83D|nr:hypothetical protein [Aurantimonas sp. 22II-16-19i]